MSNDYRSRNSTPRRELRVRVLCLLPLVAWFSLSASSTEAAPLDPKIAAAVQKAAKFIAGNVGKSQSGDEGLAAYALLKADVKPTNPVVVALLRKVLAKFGRGGYRPPQHHTYAAGVDMMALEAADPKRYRKHLQAIVKYITTVQNPKGDWYYPGPSIGGDTSISQYGVLGLWAAARAGVTIPPLVWDKAAAWHVANQMKGGGFTYQPGNGVVNATSSMTAAGTSSLLVCRLYLYPEGGPRFAAPKKKKKGPRQRFGVLEEIDLTEGDSPEKPNAPRRVNYRPKTPLAAIDKAIAGGTDWLTKGYTVRANEYPIYYLYGLERAAALANLPRIGNHDWFADGSAHLLSRQGGDGMFSGSNCGNVPGTAFAILFLTRTTSKLLGRQPKPRTPIDGGLLAGGRGLPDNLKQTQLRDGKAKERKLTGPIDKLLAELQSPQDGDFVSAQEAIIERVQLGNREELIGQKARLVKLASHPHAEVRRTVIWALGRTDDLAVAPILLKALEDAELDVMVEARNALCFLSRKPRGFGLPNTPLGEAAADASEAEQKKIVADWRTKAKRNWQRWYLAVRPYAERDDLTEPPRRNRKRARSLR
jgi:hypothetical protein